MKTVDNFNFKDQKALIRVDFNVPLDAQYNISDDTRIRAAISTIKKILNDGGSVILMSHLGRPKEGPTEKYSLKHIVDHLSKLLSCHVSFASDCIGDVAKNAAAALKSGDVLLLENLRFHKQEEKGDVDFAKQKDNNLYQITNKKMWSSNLPNKQFNQFNNNLFNKQNKMINMIKMTKMMLKKRKRKKKVVANIQKMMILMNKK